MPEVSGLSATVNAGGTPPTPNPMEDFVQTVIKAKQMQKQDAMHQLDWLMQTTQKTGALPDPKVVEKLMKQAGMPKIFTPEGAPGGGFGAGASPAGGTGDPFAAMAKQGQSANTATEATNKAATEKAQYESQITGMKAKLADDTTPDDVKARTMGTLVSVGEMPLQNLLDSAEAKHLTGNQLDVVIDADLKKKQGLMTDAQKDEKAKELIPELMKSYDGRVDLATQAAKAIMNGQTPPEPPMTDENLKRDIEISNWAEDHGLTPQMTATAQKLQTTDLGVIAKALNLDPKQLNSIKSLKQQTQDTEKAKLGIEQGRLGIEKGQLGVEQGKLKISQDEEKSQIQLREAQAFKALMGPKASSDPEMKTIHAELDALGKMKAMGKPVPQAALDALQKQVLTGITDENGMPLLQEGDIPYFFQLLSSKGWTANAPVDAEATKGQSGGPAGDQGASLTDPAVVGAAARDILGTALSLPANFGTDLAKLTKSLPAQAQKTFSDFMNAFLKNKPQQ